MLPNEGPPADWPKPTVPPGGRSAVVVLPLIALLTAVVALADAVDGDVGQAFIYAVGTLLLVHLTGVAVNLRRRPTPSTRPPVVGCTDRGERGLVFAYSRWTYYWMTMMLLTMTFTIAGFAVALISAHTVVAWAITAGCVAAVLFLVWLLVVVLRLAPGMVVLTPTGIYHRALAFEHFVPWEAVLDVQALAGRPRPSWCKPCR